MEWILGVYIEIWYPSGYRVSQQKSKQTLYDPTFLTNHCPSVFFFLFCFFATLLQNRFQNMYLYFFAVPGFAPPTHPWTSSNPAVAPPHLSLHQNCFQHQGYLIDSGSGFAIFILRDSTAAFELHPLLPFHTVHGDLKARMLKWFAIPFSMNVRTGP